MLDNPVLHGIYTFGVYCVDNVSTVFACILFTLQLIVLAPKAWRQVRRWFK